jgi:creatinine amidohydrolase
MPPASQSFPPVPYLLSEANLEEVRGAGYEVAVLPFGATEPHNLHLPYGTDTLEADWIGREICKKANQNGGRVVLLPTIPYGTETNLAGFPLAMNLMPSTILAILRDLVKSLADSGVRKVVLLNSHGGNDLKPFLRELYGQTSAHLFLCNWFQMVRDAAGTIFSCPDDHAGEMETSMILAYRPELVARRADGSLRADAGQTRAFRFHALEAGWVGLSRPWRWLTTHSGSGNPHAASPEKGLALMEVIVDRLAPFLVELSAAEIGEDFPFRPASAVAGPSSAPRA